MTTAAERTASHQPISPLAGSHQPISASSASHQPISPSSGSHVRISPSILYFGTPVALLTTENPDGTDNLAPISSAWALGHTLVLGIGAESRTAANLADRPELAVSLPSPHQWASVERLAPLTGAHPVPAAKRAVYRHEPDKFGAAGLSRLPSQAVRPARVAECPLHLEARVRSLRPGGPDDHFRIVECEVVRVHAAPSIVVPGTEHIDPSRWSPLLYNFRHYFGLGPELGHGFRSETAAGSQ
ncbi:flavin reductase family protein [Streptomyces mesophilus]|uniref:flavin reductase family protein n=1 Tax=Streptomyces mesophilus TaxID=1775132 RepID=UPI0033224EBA